MTPQRPKAKGRRLDRWEARISQINAGKNRMQITLEMQEEAVAGQRRNCSGGRWMCRILNY